MKTPQVGQPTVHDAPRYHKRRLQRTKRIARANPSCPNTTSALTGVFAVSGSTGNPTSPSAEPGNSTRTNCRPSSAVMSSPSLNGKNCVTASASSSASFWPFTDALRRWRLSLFFGCSTAIWLWLTGGFAGFGDAGVTACSSPCGLCELTDLQKMAITEIRIKIPAATAANFQLDQRPALFGAGLGAEKTVDEAVEAVCARKAVSRAASTRAGGSSPAIS